jgi:hypothetical protein
VRREELDPFDPADHDDDQHTDHLARLSDPAVLAWCEEQAREREERYGSRAE